MAKDDQILRTNKKVEELLKKILNDKSSVKVGILGKPDNPAAPKAGDNKKVTILKWDGSVVKTEHDIRLVDVAAHHEFGAPEAGIPERSFLRSTWAEEKKKITKVYAKLAKRQISKGKYNPEDTIRLAGVWFEGRVKKKFTNNNWPPLKDPSRLGKNKPLAFGPQRRGVKQSKPLIDTGQLRSSIASQFIKEKSTGGIA